MYSHRERLYLGSEGIGFFFCVFGLLEELEYKSRAALEELLREVDVLRRRVFFINKQSLIFAIGVKVEIGSVKSSDNQCADDLGFRFKCIYGCIVVFDVKSRGSNGLRIGV